MTLSEMSVFFKRFVIYGSILIVILIVGKIAWNQIADYWEKTHTPPPPPPNFALGNKIPRIKINLENTKFSNTKITLDTVDGRLPSTTPVIPIYKLPAPTINLLSLDRAKSLAASLGFINEPTIISDTEYQWKDEVTNRTLKLKTTDFNFTLIQENPNPKRTINFAETIAINDVKSFLNSRNLLPTELSEGTASARFVNISNAGVRETFRDDANAVLVDLFRKSMENKYKVLNNNAKQALVRATVTLQKSGSYDTAAHTIAELKYTNWRVDSNSQGTYPVKPINQVWEEFKANKSYLSIGSGNYNEVVINDIKLAYLLTEDYQELMQPIFVFSGKAVTKAGAKEEFISYLPAINTVSPVKK